MKKILIFMTILFYGAMIILTAYNSWFTRKQSNLIFKPIIGIADVKPTIILGGTGEEDTYDNVIGAMIEFVLKNAGSLLAKNVKIDTIGKIGNTILASEVNVKKQGVTMIPQSIAVNTFKIDKNTIIRLVENKEKLKYKIEFFYTDWDNYKEYNYSSYYEVYVIKKSPLNLGFRILSEVEF